MDRPLIHRLVFIALCGVAIAAANSGRCFSALVLRAVPCTEDFVYASYPCYWWIDLFVATLALIIIVIQIGSFGYYSVKRPRK